MKKPELFLMRDLESGKNFLEVESLIAWFESETDEDELVNRIGKATADTLRSMVKSGIEKPNIVMTEEEFRARGNQ